MRPHPLASTLAIAMIVILAHAGRTFGQETPAAPQKLPPVYTLTVDPTDLAALDRAIQELPKRIADPLLAKFDAQIGAQIAEHNKPKE